MESIGHTSLGHSCPEMARYHILDIKKDMWVYVCLGFRVGAMKMDFGSERPGFCALLTMYP